jgi:hypothetical protein
MRQRRADDFELRRRHDHLRRQAPFAGAGQAFERHQVDAGASTARR